MNRPNAINLYGLGLAIIMLASSFYLEYAQDLTPCPLCIVQRVAVMVFVPLFLWGYLTQRWRWLQLGLSIITLGFGFWASGRQIYLQHLPPEAAPSCGLSFDMMLKLLPWQEFISVLFAGSADCAKVQWQFLSLSISEWSFLGFCAFTIVLILLFRSHRNFR